MADTVRRVLEEMVPELEALEERGYFNKAEIKQIVQRRENFEYALRRRAAVKSDFTRYVDYECSLERLRQLRRKQRGIEGPATLADHCIVRRTHFIFQRALQKFRGDLSLWSSWIRFCQRSKSTRRMSRVLTRALQLHPTCASLWTYAAAWEFDSNANAVAARALMQRGLRMCKDSLVMWHEYFRMELLFAARLVARRQVLGIAINNDNKGAGPEEGDGEPADAAAAAADAVLKGAVAKVVYSSAVATVPASLNFRTGFLEVLDAVKLPGKAELEEHIFQDIMAAFGDQSGAVELQAKRATTAAAAGGAGLAAATDAGVAVFKSALLAAPSKALFTSLLTFVEGQVQRAVGAGDSGAALLTVQTCLEAVEAAADAGCVSTYAALAGPRAYMRLGQLAEALALAERLASGAGCSAVVRQRLGLQALASTLNPASVAHLSTIESAAAVKETEGGRRAEMWCSAVKAAVAEGRPLDALCQLLIEQQCGSAKGPVRGGMGAAAATLVSAVWTTAGAAAGRKLYRALLVLPLPGGELVHAVLDAELALYDAGDSNALQLPRLREVWEAAVAAYGAGDVDLWLRFLRFERRQEGGRHAGQVHWRAVKALENADAFVALASLENAGM